MIIPSKESDPVAQRRVVRSASTTGANNVEPGDPSPRTTGGQQSTMVDGIGQETSLASETSVSFVALLARLRDTGSEEAWQELIDCHGDFLRSICLRNLMDHRDLVDDALQEILIAIHCGVDRCAARDDATAAGWMVGIANNVTRDLFSRERSLQRRHREFGNRAADLRASAECADLDRELDRERLGHAFARLSERQRQAVAMYYQQGLDYETMAQRLRLPVQKTRMLVHRGRANLRRHLGQGAPRRKRETAFLMFLLTKGWLRSASLDQVPAVERRPATAQSRGLLIGLCATVVLGAVVLVGWRWSSLWSGDRLGLSEPPVMGWNNGILYDGPFADDFQRWQVVERSGAVGWDLQRIAGVKYVTFHWPGADGGDGHGVVLRRDLGPCRDQALDIDLLTSFKGAGILSLGVISMDVDVVDSRRFPYRKTMDTVAIGYALRLRPVAGEPDTWKCTSRINGQLTWEGRIRGTVRHLWLCLRSSDSFDRPVNRVGLRHLRIACPGAGSE